MSVFSTSRWATGRVGRTQELRPIHLMLSECVHYCYELWLKWNWYRTLEVPSGSPKNSQQSRPQHNGPLFLLDALDSVGTISSSPLAELFDGVALVVTYELWIYAPSKGFFPLKVWKPCSSLHPTLPSAPHFTYICKVAATQWIKPSWKTWFKCRNMDSYSTGKILRTLTGIQMLVVLIDLKIIIPFKDIARQEIYSTQVAAEGARLTGSFSFALWKNTC